MIECEKSVAPALSPNSSIFDLVAASAKAMGDVAKKVDAQGLLLDKVGAEVERLKGLIR